MSAPQPYGSYAATANHYPGYQQPPGPPQYAPAPQYQSSYGYTNGVPQSPQSVGHHGPSAQVPSQAIQLPGKRNGILSVLQPLTIDAAMHMPAPNGSHNYVAATQQPSAGYPAQHQMDTTGQTGPPGIKPKVTATLWEDEGSLCFQVEAKGVCVARREGRLCTIINPSSLRG